MAKFTYGKTFKKNGKLVCYRYKDGKKDKLVSHSQKPAKKPFRSGATGRRKQYRKR